MERTTAQRFIGNVLWNFLGQACVAALSFIAVPYIVKGLSVDLYGIYALIGVVCGYFSFLQLGLGSAAVKYISAYLAEDDQEKVAQSFWGCFFSYFLLGLLGMALIVLFARPITVGLLRIPPHLTAACVDALRLGGAGFFVSMLMTAVSGAIIGAGRFDIMNRTGILFSAAQLALAITVLKLGFSLNEVIMSSIAVNAVATLVYWRIGAGLLPAIRRIGLDPRMLVRLLKFGASFTVSSIVGPLLLNIDKIFLASLKTVSALAYYAVPFAVVDKFTLVRSSFTAVLFPTFSSLEQRGDEGLNRELHFASTLFIFFVYGFFLFFFLFFGAQFLDVWIGPDFSRQSSVILVVLALAGMVNAAAGPSLSALQGVGKPHLPALCHVLETLVYVPLCYFLIKWHGGLGAALAWLLRVAADTFLLNYFYCRSFRVPMAGFYSRLLAKMLLPLTGCFAAFMVLRTAVGGIAAVACGTAVVFFIYCFLVWVYGIEEAHREKIREFIREAGVVRYPYRKTA